MHIFQPSRSVSANGVARLQHNALFLMAYNYSLVHQKSNEVPVADVLSQYISRLSFYFCIIYCQFIFLVFMLLSASIVIKCSKIYLTLYSVKVDLEVFAIL